MRVLKNLTQGRAEEFFLSDKPNYLTPLVKYLIQGRAEEFFLSDTPNYLTPLVGLSLSALTFFSVGWNSNKEVQLRM